MKKSSIEYLKQKTSRPRLTQADPEGYTEGVSNTRRYAALGNGWTVDVIAHIFLQMK